MNTYKAVKVTDTVYWVGAIDWNIRDFHGYSTNRGTTYNAYLITGPEPVLVDTVKAPFMDEMLSRIASVLPPSSVKTIISNHAEMDHSGALPAVMDIIKPQRLLCSAMGAKALEAHFHRGFKYQTVKDGESIALDGRELTFLETRMLHWPDSMISLLEDENLLFSNDIFGMHLATSARFNDEVPDWHYEAKKYYANIILPYSDIVAAFLKKVAAKGLAPKIIAPDHGPIWRDSPQQIVNLYADWAAQKPRRKAVVTYDTMWQSTAKLAGAISEGLIETGIETKVMPLGVSHRSDVITELMDSAALAVGSPTLNQQMFPTVADCLTYLKGLKKKNLLGLAFGSYGWTPDGVKAVNETLAAMKVKTIGAPVQCQYVPDEAALAAALESGKNLGEEIKKVC